MKSVISLSIPMRIFVIILVLFLGTFCFCNSDTNENKENSTNSNITKEQNNTTITTKKLIINSNMSEPNEVNALSKLIDQFEKQYPDIDVVINTFPKKDYENSLENWLSSEDPPDVLTISAGESLNQLIRKNLVVDLDDVFDGAFDVNFPSMFKRLCSFNNKLYIVPTSWDWWVLYYRKSLFERYGLNPPENWEAFLSVCETLKSNDITPIALGTQEQVEASRWLDYFVLRSSGVDIYTNLILGRMNYTDEKIKRSFNFIGNLVKKGYLFEDYKSFTPQKSIEAILSKQAGMYLGRQRDWNNLSDNEVKKDIEFFRFPIINSDIHNFERVQIDGFAMSSKSKNKENAIEFLRFISTKEAQEFINKELGTIPANKMVAFDNSHLETMMDNLLFSDATVLGYYREANKKILQKTLETISDFIDKPDNLDSLLFLLEKERRSSIEGEDVSDFVSGSLVIYSYLSDEENQILSSIINSFVERNQYIDITIMPISRQDLQTSIDRVLKSDMPPDIITWYAGEKLRSFIGRNLIEPLDDIFVGGFDNEYYSSLKNSCGYNRNVYMLPKSFSWWAIYYNKTVFDINGLTIPNTMSELLNICSILKLKKLIPIVISAKDQSAAWWFDYVNIRTNGITFYNELMDGRIPFTDERVKNVFEHLSRMAEKNYFNDNYNSITPEEAANLVFKNDAGMYLSSENIKDYTKIYRLKNSVDFFRFPTIIENSSSYEGTEIEGFILPANSLNKKATKLFLKFLASKNSMEKFSSSTKTIPANKKAKLNETDEAYKDIKAGADFISQSTGTMQLSHTNTKSAMALKLNEKVIEFIRNTKNLSTILEDLEAERQRLF